ncbi:phage holin [Peptococcus simiae]|uniref:phage holin n=1 Tax=Peptococcus simiae TaxID=1643805 RepID=UPI00398078EE
MINWKLRLKNKPTLVALVALVVGFIYQVCGVFDIVPAISQEAIVQGLGIVINLLVALGVIVDPTTAGVKDSQAAQSYLKPRKDADHIAPEVE